MLGLGITLVLRPIESLFRGPARPLTGKITVAVCRTVLAILGLRVRRIGKATRGVGVTVANHASWLDIFVLNAGQPMVFVAKSEVGGWAGIGWLARATGTLFIRRDRAEARQHVTQFSDRIAAGQRLTLFPEGTSSDGVRVLPFKTTLFQAVATEGASDGPGALQVQPVSLRYHAPTGRDARFYGWWGDMPFGPHALAMLAERRHGTVTVRYHAPLDAKAGRKALAQAAETMVRAGFDADSRA